ncbi:alkene reductase [Steroidobacter sp.]|uniref:alkene reductase n=1 Tax=Steroidobacter sp. TaxID=1978227 RepID=UPI001A6387AE|nr:alkene reductase [Steroidobacter sp.]MBL8272016.1 alkene reductase [Steroidobacter sp.]
MKVSRRAVTQGALGTLALGLANVSLGNQAQASRLFEQADLRGLRLRNRVVMAPMTRGRAGAARTANALMAEYYGQRAEAGLIVSEATAISAQGYGWNGSPGIYTEAHAAGWRLVTDAVHARGGRIFLQLWHMGRVSHPDFLDGATPVAPSAIAAAGDTYTPTGKKPYVQPRALTEPEIADIVRDYARATRLAKQAGFDGVEIHGANSYLIDQFIRDGSNRRTDRYGGSIENRLRLLVEVTEAVTKAWSADRVGVRLSPNNSYNDMRDSQPVATFTAAAAALDRFGLAYLHLVEDVVATPQNVRTAPAIRKAFKGTLILNSSYDLNSGTAALAANAADLIAYGKPFISNPDLVTRYRKGLSLAEPNSKTFYSDGVQGYTDYPATSG